MSPRPHILLFILAFLCSQSMAFPSLLRNTIMNAHATSSGIIDIKTDYDNQFYVEADLSYYWGAQNAASNSSNSAGSTVSSSSDTGRMMISIANPDTMVATSCFNFNYYDCGSSRSCSKYSNTKSINYPSFVATVQYAQSSIYLDYNYWSLSTSNYLYLAFQCYAGASSGKFGSGISGVLGLGTGNGGSSNFGYSPIFSIFINSRLNGGKILFKSDPSTYAQSSNTIQSFSANSTWQISAYSSYFQVGTYYIYTSGNVMFDINSNAIGLPQASFNSVLNYFQYLPDVYCYSGYTTKPLCYTTKQLKDLPDLILSINGDQIKIPSQIYATDSTTSGSTTYFYFNFKATSPSLSGANYVSPPFANSIILDANFMSYYYVVFDATSGSNIIYLYNSTNVPSSPLAKWLAGGGFVAVLLISICCCAKKKKATAATTTTTTTAPLNNDTTYNNTIQAPVVYNQPINGPNYSYDANQYNYPAYQGVYQNYQQPQGYIPPANYQESAH